ncbi:bifunctional hydroxymethylpyrimidine kinase/phosphomethylpyrimidine kinase [Longibacter salinarum]|uniref:hydroxymethylpyrimidine kinase n=1 Tax=Longibacter salinarum TaxID=1850348 RepID=A0A2A8D1W3_9BACT|nr:bifunctional hydroxymethylpyrimidine kinase/phosphomethylpyrimidine kinase [Longibacter salinarum]PEN14797.1 bifunctional hydroxymethylpyrimidine kinase/phosphomethylpyrimidine kinase [Longibacter salinarum]
MTKPVALSIAGSDSGGGAGIQADLKSMEANGVFATSVITAVTAQNTEAVTMAYDLPTRIIKAQIDAVAKDFDVSATKTGMLSTSEIIRTVAEKVEEHDLFPFIVDPVMISKSGFKLLQDEAIDTLREVLLPLATITTPNIHEVEYLTGEEILSVDDAKEAAKTIFEMGPSSVLVKGGHMNETAEAMDILYDGTAFHTFTADRIRTDNTHGTGCTYASAIAANLAQGWDLGNAIERAKRYVTAAIRNSLDLGSGHGPTNHFFHLDPEGASEEKGVIVDA